MKANPPLHSAEPRPTIGLVAGWGRYPLLVAHALVRNRYRVVCAAITNHADRRLEYVCDDVRWMGVAKLGGHIRYFQRQRAATVALAGKLFKNDLIFGPRHYLSLLPDWTCIKTLWPHFYSRDGDTRDDSILSAIVDAYHQRGITICPATDFAPELLVNEGNLTGGRLSPALQRDARLGWSVAKQMGGLDIGQSITVKDGTVLAVEAIEGTDACIARTGGLCPRGGWTLIKVAKPQQDMRFDVPTIGRLTVENVSAAGGKAIVIEAGQTIIVDEAKVIETAKRLGVAIVALRHQQLAAAA